MIKVSNEDLIAQYLAGDERVLWQLITQNRGLICMFATELMKKFNCLQRTGKIKLSSYSYNIKKDLESTGNLRPCEFNTEKRIRPKLWQIYNLLSRSCAR